jgi:hypothetical protein
MFISSSRLIRFISLTEGGTGLRAAKASGVRTVALKRTVRKINTMDRETAVRRSMIVVECA